MQNTKVMADVAESKVRTAPVLAFLKARLDEDQMAARCIHRGEEKWKAAGRDVTIDGLTQSPAIARTDTDQIAAYMVRFAPQRIEAEIRAKQGIITSYEGKQAGRLGTRARSGRPRPACCRPPNWPCSSPRRPTTGTPTSDRSGDGDR